MSRALDRLERALAHAAVIALPIAALLLAILAKPARAQAGQRAPAAGAHARVRSDSVPVVVITVPTVVAVYALPPDAVLEVNDDVASLLDDFMYYWADTRPRLDEARIRPDEQAVGWRDRRVIVRLDGRDWPFTLAGDSAAGAVGYLFAGPGRRPRLLAGLLMDEDLADSARAEFARPARP